MIYLEEKMLFGTTILLPDTVYIYNVDALREHVKKSNILIKLLTYMNFTIGPLGIMPQIFNWF
jgi:hypothetical protein